MSVLSEINLVQEDFIRILSPKPEFPLASICYALVTQNDNFLFKMTLLHEIMHRR